MKSIVRVAVLASIHFHSTSAFASAVLCDMRLRYRRQMTAGKVEKKNFKLQIFTVDEIPSSISLLSFFFATHTLSISSPRSSHFLSLATIHLFSHVLLICSNAFVCNLFLAGIPLILFSFFHLPFRVRLFSFHLLLPYSFQHHFVARVSMCVCVVVYFLTMPIKFSHRRNELKSNRYEFLIGFKQPSAHFQLISGRFFFHRSELDQTNP